MTTRRRCRGEAGETLVELLMTIAIVSVAFVGILAGVAVAILGSHIHRQESTAEGVIRSYAERIADSSAYVPCPSANNTSYAAPAGFQVPSGWPAPEVASISFWQGDDALTFGSCPAGGDQGLQRLTLRVQSPAGDDQQDTETLVIVKRRA